MKNSHRAAFRGLLAARLLGALADGVMVPFVVLWAREFGGLDGPAAGALFLALACGELIGGLAGGALADRLGHRRTLVASTAGMALGYACLAVIHQPVLTIGAFLIAGLFESAFHPTIAALIGDLKEDEDLHHAFGLNRVAANLGRIAGPLIGAGAAALSLSSVFLTSGILLIAALITILGTIPADAVRTGEADEAAAAECAAPPSAFGVILRDRGLALLIAGGGLLSITYTWWEADGLALLHQQYPITTTGYAALFTIAAAATALFQIPTSRLARRYSTGRLVLVGAGFQGLGLGLLATASLGYPILVIAALAIALGQMFYGPAVSAFVSRQAAPGRRATYQAAISTTEDIGAAIGPITGLSLGAPPLIWLIALPLSLLAGVVSARATTPGGQPRSAGELTTAA
ncbi:MFS transporter [Solihabitans fulvus]|uniref:MFS transporter n=1 Tax=Solihabitans fulvus TaxID=1892852 RepID=A0A5B2WPW7_9PSEU|nr:MFS transporter [Solihabitans fulvus]KAA2252988.1 MFS transporter [Solihabitans fulvus]